MEGEEGRGGVESKCQPSPDILRFIQLPENRAMRSVSFASSNVLAPAEYRSQYSFFRQLLAQSASVATHRINDIPAAMLSTQRRKIGSER
jgi:hypothetical protein